MLVLGVRAALFEEHGVDFYFSGHVHSYERQYPVSAAGASFSASAAAYAAPGRTVHIVTGAGGNDEGHADYSDAGSPPWNAVWDNSHYGYGKLQVNSATESAPRTLARPHAVARHDATTPHCSLAHARVPPCAVVWTQYNAASGMVIDTIKVTKSAAQISSTVEQRAYSA